MKQESLQKTYWDEIWQPTSKWGVLSRLRKKKFSYAALQNWERDIFHEISTRMGSGDKLLSVGCGRALIDYWLAVVFNIDVHLLDISWPLLQKVGNSFGKVRHHIYHHDALSLPFSDNTFDVVWNEGVWEHFEENDMITGIREMSRVSKKWVVVDVPFSKSKPYTLAMDYLKRNNLWIYGKEDPKETLVPYFRKAGLEVVMERPIGSVQVCKNYLNMIPDEAARKKIMEQLAPEDYSVFPHLLTIGEKKLS